MSKKNDCNVDVSSFATDGCEDNFNRPKYTFKDDVCYKNGVKYGNVIEQNNEYIEVKIDNGNRYMQGNTIRLIFH